MGLLECASGASVWRGYDYYEENRVLQIQETGDGTYSASVGGSGGAMYDVELRLDHPRKSKCNCPHANGKRIICKHIVAAYFTVLPGEAEKSYAEVVAHQEEEEEREEQLYQKVLDHICKMKKAELQAALLELLFDGPEWQYERFVRENGLDYD